MTTHKIKFFDGELLIVCEHTNYIKHKKNYIFFDLYRNNKVRDPYFTFDFYIEENGKYEFAFNNSKEENIPEEEKITLNIERIKRCLNEYFNFINNFNIKERENQK